MPGCWKMVWSDRWTKGPRKAVRSRPSSVISCSTISTAYGRGCAARRRTKDKAAERALRDRVRAALKMPEWRTATDPKVRAQELGVDPSYDLPASSIRRTTKGRQEVQTL